MRSAAEGEHQPGGDEGETAPLLLVEASEPIGKDEVKGNARRGLPMCSAAFWALNLS